MPDAEAFTEITSVARNFGIESSHTLDNEVNESLFGSSLGQIVPKKFGAESRFEGVASGQTQAGS